MKMKEVCARTGLSERAVRLYCEQGLLSPERSEMRGRVYLDFAESHITELQQIARLRMAGFSLEEIKTALHEPHMIPVLLETLRKRLAREQGDHERVLSAIEQMKAPPENVEALCVALEPSELVRAYTNGAVLRDTEPSFREFCERGGYAQTDVCDQIDRSIDRGRIVMGVYAIWYWVSFAFSLLLGIVQVGGSFLALLITVAIGVVVFVFFRRGVLWLRVVLAIFHGLNAVFLFARLSDLLPDTRTVFTYDEFGNAAQMIEQTGSWWLFAAALAICLIEIASVYFLGFNRWVSDYLYDRSTEY